METVALFPVNLFVFRNSQINNVELIKKLEQYADHVKESSTLSYIRNLHDKEDFAELFNWFNQCLEQVRVNQKYDCDRFDITSSWFNRALPQSGMSQNYHRHSMSFFSAVYYLTDGSPTVFEDPVLHRTQAQLEVLRYDYKPYEYVQPEPGKLVIFPSWMYHSSIPHIANHDRYIVSFNTMPAGHVNYNLATDSVAHITIETKDKTL